MGKQEYYLGLDLGTGSIGWALTDTNYNLIRKKSKDLWGIREFEEADTAATRRAFRVSRRRRQREKARQNLIRSYFADAVESVDPSFFHRLDNSKYHKEDKDDDINTLNVVFDDEDYKDKDYYKQYPTVFHLRKELIENKNAPYDVRLVYLAVSNMFKHRGHFLNVGMSNEDDCIKFEESFQEFAELSEDVLDTALPLKKIEDIKAILYDRGASKTQKYEQLTKVLGVGSDKVLQELCKALCGRMVDAKKIFEGIESDEKISFSFSDYSDEKAETISKVLSDEQFQLIASMKRVYDSGIMAGIVGDYDYLSFARVASYDKHKEDLKILKRLLRKYATKEQCADMFRNEKPGSYAAYVNSYNSGNNKQRRDVKNRKRADFYDYTKKLIKDFLDDEDKTYILNEIEKESFMPKQLTSENGVIPNQIHTKELRAILSNASGYLEFLNEKDDNGLTISERIIRLFTFQIPYYVGPVTERSENSGGNGWVVRKESGAILPWNIDEKIDMNKTKERFIERLIRECTYLNGEKVLPKASLLYERYCVLNEINNIKICDEKIPVNLKQEIYNDLFKMGKKITKKKLFEYLANRGLISEIEQLSGIDVNINSSLSSYGKFRAIIGDKIDSDSGRKMVEDIIKSCTIYNDSRKELTEQIKSKYSELDDKQIKRITGMKFKDWGRLSKEFLELEGIEKGSGEIRPLISALWETNYNLMELLHSDLFTYKDSLAARRDNAYLTLADITPDVLDDFYFSPPVKKMINQTLKILREVRDVMGCDPKRVFIEMTRSEGEKGDKGRKNSRKTQLLDLYKNIKDESHDWKRLIEDENVSGRLKSKKMFLYITQMGRDMYTGKPIHLDKLFDDNLYDIDHIYPRHFVKDDSIHNNLVLVNKPDNANKSDNYPLDASIRTNAEVLAHWRFLREKNLITEEKYRRLVSNKSFTDSQKADFIARQLVETSQGTRAVADLFKQILPDTTIVYSKAANVSEFRKRYKLVKSRLINDFHHANDAYLNIVVGNAYYTKFTNNPRNYIEKEYRRDGQNSDYNLSKMFDWDVIRGNETAWLAERDGASGTIATVKKVMSKNTPIMTRQSFTATGGIADQTLYSARKAKAENYIPLKTTSDPKMSDVEKYGGFTKVSTAYFCLVEHGDESKRIRTIEAVPIYMAEKIKNNPDELKRYFESQGCKDCSIRLERILIQSSIRVNGFNMYLSGRTGNRLAVWNAVNLILEAPWISYIKKLEKYKESGMIELDISESQNINLYNELKHKHQHEIYKKRPNSISQKIADGEEMFKSLPLREQCDVLLQLLRISAIGADSQADLRKIGGAEHAGVLIISNKVSNYTQFDLILSSATGIKEKIIDLTTV